MPIFSYKVRDSQGVLINGQMEAASLDELQAYLSDRSLTPLNISQAKQGLQFEWAKKLLQRKVKGEEILVMTRQFYTLFKAGMSMEAVLGTLVKQATNPTLRDALQNIRSNVSAGESLSKSFMKYRDIFGDLYVSMLAAGEEAGILEKVLENISDLLEKDMGIKSSVKAAMLYPKIVIVVLIIATCVIMTMVVPKLTSFFGHYKSELPLPTRILIFMSHFTTNYWYLMGLFVMGVTYAFRRYSQTTVGKLKIGAFRLKMPVFGPLQLKVSNARFCHILAALYKSGLPMTRSLEITSGTIENGAFMREVEILKDDVTKGKTMSEGMAACHYFTPVVVDATAVGEKTGALDEMLQSMGNHYDIEVQHTIKNLTTLLEPFLLFFIFGAVTLFAMAIFLPIMNISKTVTGH